MKIELMEESVEIPEGVKFSYDAGIAKAEGPKGIVERKLSNPKVTIVVEGNNVKFSAKNATKREKTMIGTFKSHISNMMQGVNEGYVYKLKICSGHFPMSVSSKDGKFIVKNFIGERIPREYKLMEEVEVKIDGDEIVVSSPNKEVAGQTAASIEQLCKRPGYDLRIFQDGIYITEKAGKVLK